MKLLTFIDEEKTKFDNELKKLDKEVMIVTFMKKNGEKRIMKCTRNLKYVPIEDHPKGTGVPKKGVLAAFDIDKQEWRSFRFDSIIHVEKV